MKRKTRGLRLMPFTRAARPTPPADPEWAALLARCDELRARDPVIRCYFRVALGAALTHLQSHLARAHAEESS